MRSPRDLVSAPSGIVGIVGLAIAVYLVYFVIEVASQLDVWPF